VINRSQCPKKTRQKKCRRHPALRAFGGVVHKMASRAIVSRSADPQLVEALSAGTVHRNHPTQEIVSSNIIVAF